MLPAPTNNTIGSNPTATADNNGNETSTEATATSAPHGSESTRKPTTKKIYHTISAFPACSGALVARWAEDQKTSQVIGMSMSSLPLHSPFLKNKANE